METIKYIARQYKTKLNKIIFFITFLKCNDRYFIKHTFVTAKKFYSFTNSILTRLCRLKNLQQFCLLLHNMQTKTLILLCSYLAQHSQILKNSLLIFDSCAMQNDKLNDVMTPAIFYVLCLAKASSPGYSGPIEQRYFDQIFTIVDNITLFFCPYYLEVLNNRNGLTFQMWNFTVVSKRMKILTDRRLENLKRDFSKYPWDDILNGIRFGKCDEIEKLGIEVDEKVKLNTFGFIIPKDKKKGYEEENESDSDCASENLQDENSQDVSSQGSQQRTNQRIKNTKRKKKLGESIEKSLMLSTLRTIHEEKKAKPPTKRTKIIHTNTLALAKVNIILKKRLMTIIIQYIAEKTAIAKWYYIKRIDFLHENKDLNIIFLKNTAECKVKLTHKMAPYIDD
ncbi:hypothetical protein RFI_15981 [Reticulomyxa filosa]|uniref:Uncharacterized protein n=1 Tax=Reticulomyxa filosa TaxID=46433 RepID=X6N7D3_RETFI|nr:hypothetical protein RFI_15981 [Reticulomyxa filosa]|eukprot:ETO21222.1 hypothetical protein RFI_15981 [Reticulomyxa filosa]